MTKELNRLAQGITGLMVGTDTIVFMDREQIRHIPWDRTVTYARIVVDYRPQKFDPNRVRITVGGNLIDYPGKITMRTADMVASKFLYIGCRRLWYQVRWGGSCTTLDCGLAQRLYP